MQAHPIGCDRIKCLGHNYVRARWGNRTVESGGPFISIPVLDLIRFYVVLGRAVDVEHRFVKGHRLCKGQLERRLGDSVVGRPTGGAVAVHRFFSVVGCVVSVVVGLGH